MQLTVPKQALLLAGDMSQATLASSGIYLGQIFVGSVQAIYTGAPVGTLTLEGSNDNVPLATQGAANLASNVVNWTTLDAATAATVSVTTAGSYLWNLPATGYLWVRAKYVKISGTGALTIQFCGKG